MDDVMYDSMTLSKANISWLSNYRHETSYIEI